MLKRLFLLIISVCILIPVLTACEDAGPEISDGGVISEPEKPKTQPDPAVKTAIDAFYSGEKADRSGQRVSVSKGKKYTPDITAGDANGTWGDPNGTLLTDGNIPTGGYSYSSGHAGFVMNYKRLEIVLDLGKTTDGICDIESNHVMNDEAGIRFTVGGEIWVSDDGENYTKLGALVPDNTPKLRGTYTLGLYLQESVSVRYIKYIFEVTQNWTFISEIAAYAYTEGTGIVFVEGYPECEMPAKVETESLWSASESDYNDKINLLLNKPYQMFCPIQLRDDFYKNSDRPATGKLTDGKYASDNNFSRAEYYKMVRGVMRDIVFDLEKTSAVSGYKLSFCCDLAARVNPPDFINIFISENGTDWFFIKRVNNINPGSPYTEKVVVEGSLGKEYKARFVGISFSLDAHAYCDEIEITGKKNISAAEAVGGTPDKFNDYPDKYASPDLLDGVHDIVLMPNAHPTTGGLITEEETLSYFAYLSTEGEILDYMFDGYLYCPFSLHDRYTLKGWNDYLDNTFRDGYNIDALDKVVETVNKALGGNKKAYVYLSIFHPYKAAGKGEFGDIDDDGINEDFDKLEDRNKAVKYLVDKYLELWEQKGYKNLVLAGFYWQEESVSYAEEPEVESIMYASALVHGYGYKITWIPWFWAPGFQDWSNLGIDVACMQPNYFWFDPMSKVYENAFITKALGMCVEFEVDEAVLGSVYYRKRYKEYLKEGILSGYMEDTVHMYYMSGGPGLFHTACHSEDQYDRSVYDDTYKFIKGTLTIDEVGTLDPQSFDCDVNGFINGRIEFDNSGNTYAQLYSDAKYGTLKLNTNGKFIYRPFDKFGGEDCFYIYLDNDYTRSDPVKITVNVG